MHGAGGKHHCVSTFFFFFFCFFFFKTLFLRKHLVFDLQFVAVDLDTKKILGGTSLSISTRPKTGGPSWWDCLKEAAVCVHSNNHHPLLRPHGGALRWEVSLVSWARTTVSQDVQTWFPVQLAFAKFLSKIKGNFWGTAVSMILALY